jgi:hypothetical protein
MSGPFFAGQQAYVTPVVPLGASGGTTNIFGPSGPSHRAGLVPDPGSSAGTTRFLREDATFAVPPISPNPVPIAQGGTGQVTGSAAFNALSPITTRGDLIAGGVAGVSQRLAVGGVSTALISNGTDPSWGVVPVAGGGTGQITAAAGFNALSPITTRGDLITGGVAGVSQRLPLGGVSTALVSNGTDPVWGTVAIAGGGTGQITASAAFNALSPITTRGDLIVGGVAGVSQRLALGPAGYALMPTATDAVWTPFQRSETGAITRTWQSKAAEASLSVKDFGVVGDGTTDDTTNMQNAINAAIAAKLPLYIPSGFNIKITSTLTSNNQFCMFSVGLRVDSTNGTITYTPTTGNALAHTADSPLVIRGINWFGNASATAGAQIQVRKSAGGNVNTIIEDCYFGNGFNQIDIDGAGWTIQNNIMQVAQGTALIWANSVSPGGGDVVCQANTFTPASAANAVTVNSGSGFKFYGNKIASGTHGLTINIGANALADYNIVGNSLENNGQDVITITQTSGSLFNLVITGNQVSGQTVACFNFPSASVDYLTGVVICGNQIQPGGNGTGILLTSARVVSINGNCFYSPGGTQTGIKLNTGVHHADISCNRLFAFTTPVDLTAGLGARVFIHDNGGYQPIGAQALTPGASPWTFTNGNQPSVIYLSASTSITALTENGVSILPAASAANATITVYCAPLEVFVITYTGTLTGKQMVL